MKIIYKEVIPIQDLIPTLISVVVSVVITIITMRIQGKYTAKQTTRRYQSRINDIQRDKNKGAMKAMSLFMKSINPVLQNVNKKILYHYKELHLGKSLNMHNVKDRALFCQVTNFKDINIKLLELILFINVWSEFVNEDIANFKPIEKVLGAKLREIKIQCKDQTKQFSKHQILGYRELMKHIQ